MLSGETFIKNINVKINMKQSCIAMFKQKIHPSTSLSPV